MLIRESGARVGFGVWGLRFWLSLSVRCVPAGDGLPLLTLFHRRSGRQRNKPKCVHIVSAGIRTEIKVTRLS